MNLMNLDETITIDIIKSPSTYLVTYVNMRMYLVPVKKIKGGRGRDFGFARDWLL